MTSPILAEPIVRVVKRYICPFCHRGRSTEKLAVDHIATCWKNPAVRSCRTCGNYTPAEADEIDYFAAECKAGIPITPIEPSGIPMVTNCEKWVPNE